MDEVGDAFMVIFFVFVTTNASQKSLQQAISTVSNIAASLKSTITQILDTAEANGVSRASQGKVTDEDADALALKIADAIKNSSLLSSPNKLDTRNRKDNNIIYTLQSHKAGALIDGYPFIEAVYTSALNAVLVTKKSIPFLPVTRRQYLILMKKYAELSLAVQKKSLVESIKEKLGIEAAITPLINYCLNDIKQVDAFIAGHTAEYLNKPCITNHNFESLFGKSFEDGTPYFFDTPGAGKEWVIINPGYINKKLPAAVPQFFCISWSQGEKEVEKKAALLFKQTFDFKKMEELLAK